jgi:glycerol uptake facilitator-like aquaporin
VYSRTQKLLAESFGTFAVVLAVSGARPAVAYLRDAAIGPAGIAVFYGVAYGVALAALGRFSGGHFNPAVTTAHWVTHRLGTFEALLYFAAQLAGAAAASYTLRLAVPATAAGAALVGPPVLAAGVTRAPALLIEAAMAFALVLALWATLVGRTRPCYWLGGTVASAVIAAASFMGAPYTGGVMNPARAFGPALAAQQWAYQGVYWVGPLAGAVAAASLYDLLFRRRQTTPQEMVT